MKNRKNHKQAYHRRSAAITLALGGGGSRGAAHVGVLRVLEREGIRVAGIAGSSIGGLIAAVYAAGHSAEEIEKRLAVLQNTRLFRHPTRVPNALIGLDGIATELRAVLGDIQFSELDIPLAVTALDVASSEEVVIREGSVMEAVLATIAIPGVFPSRAINGYELVDGGLSNPVPVEVARRLAPRLPVVAVALSQPPHTETVKASGHGTVTGSGLDSLPIPGPIRRLRLGQAFQAFLQAMSASGRIQGELRLQVEKPDVVIRPDVEHVGVLDAVDVPDLARRGEEAAMEALPQLRAAIQRRSPLGKLRGVFSKG